MIIYVNKSTKNIKSLLFLVFLLIKGTFNSILPFSFGLRLLITFPLLLIKALIPLLADLTTKVLFSIDLNTALAKC